MRYDAEQLEFLRTEYPALQISELTEAFNLRFGTALGEGQIKAACKNHKIKCGRPVGSRVGTYRLFTKAQAEYLNINYKHNSQRDLTAEFNAAFGMSMTDSQIRSFLRNHGIYSGRTGRFKQGHCPWNSGTKGKGLTGANKGSFRKGNLPPNRKPLGTERKDRRRDGKASFILVKVAETDPYTGFPTRYKHKHVVLWEQAHGPVPKGMVVAFIDGNEENCVVENLMLINRAELLRLNKRKYRAAPNELKPSILALAKLEVKTFDLVKTNSKV